MLISHPSLAPAIEASEWLNTPDPITLQSLRGKVVAVHFFQMLCPACVTHSMPQASLMNDLFPFSEVRVLGVHSVFEHHHVMTVDALKTFIHEFRLKFPVAVDDASDKNPIPLTMQKYHLQGTPSLILIDKTGHVRLNHFGHLNDMQVGNLIGRLVNEKYEDG
jgi:peroxiredoxin